jgi:hypothetical protein
MKFQVTNIGGGINVETATLSLQEVREQPDAGEPGAATPNPVPVSSLQLVVPLTEAQNYAIGAQYEMTLDVVEKPKSRR